MTGGVREVLGEGGIVAARLPGYELRPQQLELAAAVEHALQRGRHLLAEAGTGVGKTFAYLLPAVQWACDHTGTGPVVVSTRTIALQHQLERADLPFLHGVLPLEWSSVTAIGRSHYVCLRRMHMAIDEGGRLFDAPDRQQQLMAVADWSVRTGDGTRMDLPRPVDDAVWDEVRAEHGNCLHRACPHFQPCPYQRARRRMDGAQVLVVNHALYMADVALRIAGASYLPPHRVVIFDEAHHLMRVATENLGLRLTEAGLLWHLRRINPKNPNRSLLQRYGSERAIRLWHELRGAVPAFFAELDAMLGNAGTLALGERQLDAGLAELLHALGAELDANSGTVTDVDRRMELQSRAQGLLTAHVVLRSLCAPAGADSVRWLERARRGPELRSAPLEVADALAEHVFGGERVGVLVSATLGAGADPEFTWMRQQLGVGDADSLRLGSPFDYRAAVRVVLEEGLPDPSQQPAAFLAESKQRVLDHLLDNGGRALVLCTSWAFVNELAEFVRPELQARGLPLLIQGEAPLRDLLQQKRELEQSVLIGTDSLWEGIDVPGEALTLVIVTRLPFARPDHPLARARMRAVEQRGGNAFAELSLPDAVLKLRQGFGRLVRSGNDRGTVVILDPRVRTKRYGTAFLQALPEGALED